MQVKSSDIQVGDLIIVEKVDAFLISFRHVYASYEHLAWLQVTFESEGNCLRHVF